MEDKEFSDNCHTLIHSLRLISGYKPNPAEIKLSRWVIEKYATTCKECQEAKDRLKNQPDKPKGLLDNIKEAMK